MGGWTKLWLRSPDRRGLGRRRGDSRNETPGVGTRRSAERERRPARSFSVSGLFKGLRMGKFRLPSVSPRTTPRTDAASRLLRPARLSPPLHWVLRMERIRRFPTRFCMFSRVCREEKFPSLPGAASRTLGALRRAVMSVRKRTASAIRGSRPRAVDDSARRNCWLRARRAAAGFMGEHGHGFSSSEVERRE